MFEILDQVTLTSLVPQISFGLSIVTALFATNSKNKWVNLLLRGLNFLSVNVGKNKNKDDRD